ncbi:GntR family transcriptional regulator [Rhodococcus sp. IEGM 1330]|uniref:GntR family transcriptional regulator n=1 Tax=Rhodococcus sp. IEGM 1330 TaxID=3082225 RepID=UPI00295426AE|nr:GntR family transcriptional regulator [Rhodococcus sp. IEGM 1330]MDV8020282.1 GntR family transcriptional regulator [Rhodococcus sp. IEGM 1330]
MPPRRRSILLSQLSISAPGGPQPSILRELRRVILAGDAPPNTPIPLNEVAELFGVSRIPVRESLKTLIGEGLVDHRPNLGYTVAQLTAAELREMYIVREVLETAALPIAVELATDADREHIIEINRQLEASLARDDSREYHRLSREFHLALTNPSRMHRLLNMLESAWNITEPVQPMVHVAETDRSSLHSDHAEMLSAFLARDSEALLNAAQHHHTRLNSVISTLSNEHGLFADPAPDASQ